MEGRFNGGFFCVTGLGGLYLEGLIHGGAYFRTFTVYINAVTSKYMETRLDELDKKDETENHPPYIESSFFFPSVRI